MVLGSHLGCMKGGIMGFMCIGAYIPGGTGPMGVGSMPCVTDDGPGPNCEKIYRLIFILSVQPFSKLLHSFVYAVQSYSEAGRLYWPGEIV